MGRSLSSAASADGPKLVERLVEQDLVLAASSFRECRPSMTVDLALRAGIERALARPSSTSGLRV
jgi:hypothetical protein